MTFQTGNTIEATPNAAAMPKRKLLTSREACEYLFGEFNRTTKERLYRYLRTDKISSVRLSGDRGHHYWRVADLDALTGGNNVPA